MRYTIPASEREKIEKMTARLTKKAAAYGSTFSVKFGENYSTVRDIFKVEFGVQTFVDKQMIEVFDIDIDGDMIQKDGYKVVAKIEHMPEGNVVYPIGSVEIPDSDWSHIPARCEHCGGKHGQKVTFMVRDAQGKTKQVGRTCLKDYCGINPQLMGVFNQMTDLVLDLDIDHYDFDEHPVPNVYDTKKILALSIRLNEQYGYRSSRESKSNKQMMADCCKGIRLNDDETKAAEDLADKIMQLGEDEARAALLDNVQVLLRCGYCKQSHFGYIAYAPMAFARYIERKRKEEAREAAKNSERAASHYVGEIGKRMSMEVSSFELMTSWDGDYGMTYLYKITDSQGNILIWFSSKYIEHPEEVRQIKATVKDHTDRDGVKQTVVTRCAVQVA